MKMNDPFLRTKLVIIVIAVACLVMIFHQQGIDLINTYYHDDVEIPDLNLKREIRTAANKPLGPILYSDLEQISELECTRKQIETIEGLQHCTNLVVLYLAMNEISDLTPLAELTKLRFIDLSLNKVTDLSPLARLPDLSQLDLSGNPIREIESLMGMNSLQDLALTLNMDLSDISPLLELPNLNYVKIADNFLSEDSINNVIPELEQRGVQVDLFHIAFP